MTTEIAIKTIPSDWEEISFSEAVEVNPTRELKKGSVAKSVSMADIQPFTRRISKSTPGKFKSGSKFKNGDTLFARITPCLENGKTAFVDILADGEIGFGSTEFIVLAAREGKTTPHFVYYLSLTPDVRNAAIKSMTGTSGRQRVEYSVFDNIITRLPPLKEQNRIAKILSDLDSKIELNQQMNKTLEAIAQAIFKHWFVDFEFPNEEGKPYRSSGGEMIDSSLGEIPINWKVGALGDIAESPRRGILPHEIKAGTPYIGLEHMPRRDIALPEWTDGEYVVSNKFQFLKGEILFGKLRPYFHKVGVAPLNGVCSTDILVITPKSPEWYGLVLCHVSSNEFVKYADATSTGTRMPRTSWEVMASFQVAIPPIALAKAFTDIISPLLQRINGNILHSRSLSSIRDALLPRLMSGKIRVPVEVR